MQGKPDFSIALMISASCFTVSQEFSHRSYYVQLLNLLKDIAETSLEKGVCVLASCCPTRNQFASSTNSHCKS